MKPRLIIEQSRTTYVDKYEIFTAIEDGSRGELLAVAQHRHLATQDKISFYTNEVKTDLVCSVQFIKSDRAYRHYLVRSGKDRPLGAFVEHRQAFGSDWAILDENEHSYAFIRDSNVFYAALRRLSLWFPITIRPVNFLATLGGHHYIWTNRKSGKAQGRYYQKKLFDTQKCLSLTDNAYDAQNWRILAAVVVAIDAEL
jgi:hypothetical protein